MFPPSFSLLQSTDLFRSFTSSCCYGYFLVNWFPSHSLNWFSFRKIFHFSSNFFLNKLLGRKKWVFICEASTLADAKQMVYFPIAKLGPFLKLNNSRFTTEERKTYSSNMKGTKKAAVLLTRINGYFSSTLFRILFLLHDSFFCYKIFIE